MRSSRGNQAFFFIGMVLFTYKWVDILNIFKKSLFGWVGIAIALDAEFWDVQISEKK